jgi:hypothetical protein
MKKHTAIYIFIIIACATFFYTLNFSFPVTKHFMALSSNKLVQTLPLNMPEVSFLQQIRKVELFINRVSLFSFKEYRPHLRHSPKTWQTAISSGQIFRTFWCPC